jgi:Lrp/AsnC family transcriptional regulator for asnA, asnC and gidA
MDETDLKILSILQRQSDIQLRKIGIMTGLNSPSAVSRRIEAMKKLNIIKNNIVIIDYKSIGFDFYTITFVRAKYGKEYYKDLGKKLMKIPGIISVDFLLGDIDFVLYTISRNGEEYQKLMDTLSTIDGIERTDSHIILQNFSRDNYGSIKL